MQQTIKPIVDWERQNQERNIHWGDFPMINFNTGRRLRKNCDFYYSSWDEYVKETKGFDYRSDLV